MISKIIDTNKSIILLIVEFRKKGRTYTSLFKLMFCAETKEQGRTYTPLFKLVFCAVTKRASAHLHTTFSKLVFRAINLRDHADLFV